MVNPITTPKSRVLTMAIAAILSAGIGSAAQAANHREAPLTAIDTKADITDWFTFVSYDNPNKVTMILNVDPFLEPSNGPNYFPFDHEIQYDLKVDNNRDAEEDVIVRVTFAKPIPRAPGVFTGFVGVGAGVNAPANAPPTPPALGPGMPIVPPAITALDGPGAAGLSLRQTYNVKILKKVGTAFQTIVDSTGQTLFAVPSNVGPRTMPTYDALAAQGIYTLNANPNVKVFAGTVDDPFYIDLGAAFDTLNFRVGGGVLTAAQDASETANFAPDDVSGFNVNSIAVELPVALLTSDGLDNHAVNNVNAVIGTYGTTSRPRIKIQPSAAGGAPSLSTNFTAIQRMGNPLVNELLIGTGSKDKFSMSEPKNDSQFASFVLDPLLARVINAATAGAVDIPDPPRNDLLPLVLYRAPICPGCTTTQQMGPVADLLRLNTAIPPTPMASRKRLGVLANDLGGFPNGRRVSDDVTDIAARVVVGVLAGAPFNAAPNSLIGDGTNANDRPYQETFPYVAFANSGRASRHVDPTEPGCNGGNCPP